MFQFIIITILIIINLLAIYAVFVEPFWLEVTRDEKCIIGASPSVDGLTIVHISDVHMDWYGWGERRIVDTVNALDADIICVTGDLTNYRRDFSHAIRFLNDLRSRYGTFVVFGNVEYHNYREVEETLQDETRNVSVHILRNDSVRVPVGDGGSVMIYGLDDPISGAAQYRLLSGPVDHSAVSIVLMHCYVHTDQLSTIGDYDVVLSGHTHGGQARILPDVYMTTWLSNEYKITIPYLAGRHEEGNASIFVSRGLGTSALPLRFNARPQVGLVTVRVMSD